MAVHCYFVTVMLVRLSFWKMPTKSGAEPYIVKIWYVCFFTFLWILALVTRKNANFTCLTCIGIMLWLLLGNRGQTYFPWFFRSWKWAEFGVFKSQILYEVCNWTQNNYCKDVIGSSVNYSTSTNVSKLALPWRYAMVAMVTLFQWNFGPIFKFKFLPKADGTKVMGYVTIRTTNHIYTNHLQTCG